MDAAIDANDKAILKELQKDASISNLELSKKIGLSPSACLARTKNLRETGVIKQFTTIVDEKALGIGMIAFALISLSPMNQETSKAFLEKVNSFPQIQECYTLTGTHDYLLKIIARDISTYRDFIINNLMDNSFISNVETCVVMGVDKHTTFIPVDYSDNQA